MLKKKRRLWKDIHIARFQVFLWYTPKEIMCSEHGRIQEEIPWAAPNAQVSERLEFLVAYYAQRMTQKAAAELLGLSASTFSDILHRIITRKRAGHKIRNLRIVGIDEISYCKGKKYATVVYDLERSKVVWVAKGKGKETINYFFTEVLSQHKRNSILYGVCDMSQTYMNAILEHCKNATLILDRFHVVKALNDAMDEVRKEEWREVVKNGSAADRKALKGLRWILFRHSSNRTQEDRVILKHLAKSNNRIHRAWILKDELEKMWDYSYQGCAEKYAKAWITRVLRSRIEPMKKFAHTLRKNLEHIIAFIGPRLTNAVAEGINRIIRMIKNQACGFRSFDAFVDMIYLKIGDVDIVNRFPQRNQTVIPSKQ